MRKLKQNYITSKDVQRILHIGRNSALKLISLPDFPKVRIGRSIRIPEEDFYKYMESYKNLSINI